MEIKPDIAVVVASYNRRSLLELSIPAILGQELPPQQFEVIVVIDGSTDDSAAYLATLQSECRLTIIEQSNQGAAAARNAGIRIAQADLVLFLDDDIVAPPHLLSRHIKAQRGHNRRVAVGALDTSSLSVPTLATAMTIEICHICNDILDSHDNDGDETLYVDLDPNCSLNKSLFDEVGGYDENFGTMLENREIGIRLRAAGAEFFFVEDARVVQIYDKSTRTLSRDDAFQMGYAAVMLSSKLPYFRPDSRLAVLSKASRLKRSLYYLVPMIPLLDSVVAGILWICEKLMHIQTVRTVGLLLLSYRERCHFWRGAKAAAGSWQTLLDAFGRSLPVLNYGRIGLASADSSTEPAVSPRTFAKHLAWLKRWGYSPVSAMQWIKWLEGSGQLPPKPVLLTFDHAAADTMELALPLLQDFGYSATIFVDPDAIEPGAGFRQRHGENSNHMMQTDRILHWSRQGFEFGVNFRALPALSDLSDNAALQQLARSKARLAAISNQPVGTMAYRTSRFDSRIQTLVKSQFSLAFSGMPGRNLLNTDPANMRRNTLNCGDGLLDIYGYLRWGFSPRKILLNKLNAFRRSPPGTTLKTTVDKTRGSSHPR